MKANQVQKISFLEIPAVLVAGALLSATPMAWAEPSSCAGAFSNVKQIVRCALETHPGTQRAKNSLGQGDALESVAAQRPNPELSSKAVFGGYLGDNVASTELNLTQTFELGGKRGSRMAKANAAREALAVEYLKSKEEVVVETYRLLYRVRQVEAERHAVDEALETFRRIQNQYRSRPKLGAEQQISLNVFGLAEADYRLKKTVLDVEAKSLQVALKTILGRDLELNKSLLPGTMESWPALSDSPPQLKGSAFQSFAVDLKVAEADLEMARSLSWPDLKLGPSLELQTQGALSYQTFGFNLSLPIPLLQMNGAAREYAHMGVDRAQQSLDLRQRELTNEKQILVKRYADSVQSLKSTVSAEEVERKHRSMETIFTRGLIPSSLVIEAHRQMVDLTKSRNEMELSALQALWQVYTLEGRLFEELL
jgi:cobalt-zinc-cadmium efflux system outer membrane protein